MKTYEQELRDQIATNRPFTLVTSSGARVKVRSHDHIILPPRENENGAVLKDRNRSDFFQVWSNGQSYRWVAFSSINLIETKAPTT